MASKELLNDNIHEDWNNNAYTPTIPQGFVECCQTMPTTLNAAANPLTSSGTNNQEVCDLTSNAVINFICQIMLEEDIDDEESIYQEEAALRETEKSFYDILEKEKEYPLFPSLIKSCTTQNDNTTNSSTDSEPEPLLINADNISILSMENLAAAQVQNGVEEATKLLPALEELFVGLEPNRNGSHEEPKKNYVSEKKAIGNETCTKRCAPNDREPNLSEGRVCKQQAVSSDEPARNVILDQFLLTCGREYASNEKFPQTVRENMKQQMRNKSWKNQADKRSEVTLGNEEKGERLVDLRSLLLHCSEAVSAYDYSRAYELINRIRRNSSPKGDCSQRVAHYLVDALEARLLGTGSDIYHEIMSREVTVTDYLRAYRIYHAICPFMRTSLFFTNQTLLNVSKNATKVHIIDFGIHMGFMWPSFFERLSSIGCTPPKIRITGIEFPQKGFRPAKLVEETGRRLLEYAQRYNIRLKYQGIASNWEDIRIEDLKIEGDEVLVVKCIFGLKRVADETTDMSCPRDKVLRMIREIKPRVFIHGILNGSYNTPFFITRFKEVVSKLFSFFDILESNLPRDSEARLHLERNLVSPKAINAIACEGSEWVERPETYKQWHIRNVRAGFVQLPVDPVIKKNIEKFVRELYHKDYVFDEDKKWLLLGWKGLTLFGLSTWIPNEHEGIQCK
jgi:GRAS domain family